MASRTSKTRLIVVVLVIVIAAIVGIALSRYSSSPSDSTLPIITWDETTLSTLEGTPVVLNFWSISCYWCRYHLPFLEAVAQQSGGEIKVIAVNMVDSAASVQNFFGDYEPTLIVALDENREAFVDYCQKYDNPQGAIPFTLFVDSEGIIKYWQTGAFSSEAQLWDTLNSVFETTVP